MPRFSAVFALTLALAASAKAADMPDYFAPRAGMDADTALYLDAWSGKSLDALRARLNASPAPANAADGWSLLCDSDYHAGAYAQAIADCQKAAALDPQGGAGNALAIVQLLVNEAPPRASGFAKVPVT